jgi:phage gp46-like protein
VTVNIGAGGYAAGKGPAGFAPVAEISLKLAVDAPRAVNYDPQIKSFTSTNGYYDSIHPVDQAVDLALTIPLGSIKSSPTTGNTLHLVGRNSGVRLAKDAEDRARLALKRLTDAGEINILFVDTDTTVRGQLKVAVTYQNLVTMAKPRTKTTNVSLH